MMTDRTPSFRGISKIRNQCLLITPRICALFLFSFTTMNLVKKFLAGAASVAVFCTSSLVSVSVANANSFSDIVGHWSESYVSELADAGIISTNNADGSPKSSYYPDNSLTRAELTKLAIEAFYGDSVSDLADAFADNEAPSFTDVPASEWYFQYVEIAKGLEIVQGVGGGQFAPNAPITRSAALKVILLTGDIEDNLDPEAPFTDVMSSDWSYNFVTTAYNDCIVNGTSATTFSPNGNVTRGEVAKILSNAIKVSDGQDICEPSDEDEDNTDEDNTDEDNTDEDDVVTYDGTLEVSLSADSPDAQSIPQNGSNIPFLALDFTNTGNDDVEVKGLVVAHGGLGDESEVDSVKVFDGIKQRGSDRSFTSDEEIAQLNFSNDPVVVEAGTTKTIVVAFDMDAGTSSGGEHNASILSPSDITAVAADSGADVEVAGDFPVRGATMRVSNVAVGSLDFDYQSVADNEVEVGQAEVEFAKMKLTATSTEDVLLQAMTLEFQGADDGDLANLYVEFNGTRVSEVADFVENEKVTFDLTNNDDEGFVVEKGKNITVRIKGDVLAGVSNDITVGFDDVASDVLAHGLVYGFGIGLTDTGSPDTVSIIGGDITFAFNSSARDVATDTDNVEFGVLTLSNMGEAVELQKNLTLNVGGSANDLISDVRLVDLATGKTFMGPEDPDGSNDVVFGDEQILETGDVLTLSLQGDIAAATGYEGRTIEFTLDNTSIEVKGIESNRTSTTASGEHDIRPKSDISTKEYTIAEPSITFTSKTLSSDFYVSSAKGAIVWKGSVRASDVQDVVVRSMTFTQATGPLAATEDDIIGFSLYKKEGNVMTPVETDQDLSGANIAFNSLDEDGGTSGLLVPAGDEFELVLTADISSEATSTRTIIVVLDTDSVDAEDEQGDDAEVTNAGDLPTTGVTFTLQDNGNLTVSLDSGNTPDSTILVAGQSTPVPVAVFKAEAQYEDIQIKDATVTINNVVFGTPDAKNDVDAIDAVYLYYYDDGTPVKKTTGQAASVPTLNASNGAYFQGLDLIVENGDSLLIETRVAIRDMDDNSANATATSGMAFTANLNLTPGPLAEVRGADSGALLVLGDITGAVTSAGNNMYIFNNKVIAEKSSGQPTTANFAAAPGANNEVMKITLSSSGDNTDLPYLESIDVQASASNSTGGDVSVAKLYLKDKDGATVASCTATNGCKSGNTFTLLIGDTNEDGAIVAPEVQGTNKIDGGSEVFIIEADLAGTSSGSNGASVTTTVFINGSAPNTTSDSITWKDGGTDGTDGQVIKWIDLGTSDASTTRIENTVRTN